MKPPTYGTSLHYTGEEGESYFEYQNTSGRLRGELNAFKFSPHINPADTVLDFGCGAGHLLKALDCSKRLGIEINPAARDHAISQGIEAYADMREVPEAVADVAISNHALEHVPYPIEALRQIRRALKPRCRLVLCVPIDDWRRQGRYDSQDINNHLNTWTPQLLGNTLVEAGYMVAPEDISILAHAWPPNYEKLWNWSPIIFHASARIWSRIRFSRQLLAVVHTED